MAFRLVFSAGSLVVVDLARRRRAPPAFCEAPASESVVHKPHLPVLERSHLVVQNRKSLSQVYDVHTRRGDGAFGSVFEATHKATGIRRAVKQVRKGRTRFSEFVAEVEVLAEIDHPHVVNIVEWFEDQYNFFIVEELCTGPDLLEFVLARKNADFKGLSEKEVSIIMRQALKALVSCHAQGIIHRDVKPENFMITGVTQTVKMIDLGLAARFAPQEHVMGHVGTEDYMAPEVLFGQPQDSSVDIFSLGVTLYVLLTGTFLLPQTTREKQRALQSSDWLVKRVSNSKQLSSRNVSATALDLLARMLEHDPRIRIRAGEALSHPFILAHWHDHLGGVSATLTPSLDAACIERLRLFAECTTIKKIGKLAMVHVVSAEDEHLERARMLFRSLDKSGVGMISFEELLAGLHAHELEAPPDLRSVFDLCDCDGKGQLSLVEWLSCHFDDKFVNDKLCREVFNLLDRSGTGSLDPADLRQLTEDHREVPLPQGRDFITYDEFRRHMMSQDMSSRAAGCA